ncbi:GDSL esterase/lipase At5g45960-like [Ipomoea triloba]|uniref:GDSL esterase/lipase At5g45960-like n=1 Tax=Ipomoea triloba TaxID=35885 RepID=UPI00125CF820|nr:GDSL esterase/lipase At5g45960-like [Ipomoea triloba]
MASSYFLRFSPFLQLLLIIISIISATLCDAVLPTQRPFNNTISGIFIFGDSTVDSGNNNFIRTVSKCDFAPYGRDFDQNHTPTGRFTNGRLVTDFISSYVGIKEFVPPYLDSSLGTEELITGVSFASGGSGYDPLTSRINGVIPMEQQLQYFREYRARIAGAIGEENTKLLISKAAFLISAGTNDLVVNYYGTPFRRQNFTVSQYQHFLLQLTHDFIQELIKEGAQLIGIVGLPPIGCLPIVITTFSGRPFSGRQCLDTYSAVAREYNQMLQDSLQTMKNECKRIVYADIYKPIDDMVQNPTKYGFEDVHSGCCGSGYFEVSILCNLRSVICPNASKYVFWDSVHPTEATYYHLFEALKPTIDIVIKN